MPEGKNNLYRPAKIWFISYMTNLCDKTIDCFFILYIRIDNHPFLNEILDNHFIPISPSIRIRTADDRVQELDDCGRDGESHNGDD